MKQKSYKLMLNRSVEVIDVIKQLTERASVADYYLYSRARSNSSANTYVHGNSFIDDCSGAYFVLSYVFDMAVSGFGPASSCFSVSGRSASKELVAEAKEALSGR